MGDVQGSSVQGVNYLRRNLSRFNYLGAFFLGGNWPRNNCPGGSCSGGVQWELAIILGGNCPAGNFSSRELPWEKLFEGQQSRGSCPVPKKFSWQILIERFMQHESIFC